MDPENRLRPGPCVRPPPQPATAHRAEAAGRPQQPPPFRSGGDRAGVDSGVPAGRLATALQTLQDLNAASTDADEPISAASIAHFASVREASTAVVDCLYGTRRRAEGHGRPSPDEARAEIAALLEARTAQVYLSKRCAAFGRDCPSTAERRDFEEKSKEATAVAELLRARAAYVSAERAHGRAPAAVMRGVAVASDALLRQENRSARAFTAAAREADAEALAAERRSELTRRADVPADARARRHFAFTGGEVPHVDLIHAMRGSPQSPTALPQGVKMTLFPSEGTRKYGVRLTWPRNAPAPTVRLLSAIADPPVLAFAAQLPGETTERIIPFAQLSDRLNPGCGLDERYHLRDAERTPVSRALYEQLKAVRATRKRAENESTGV